MSRMILLYGAINVSLRKILRILGWIRTRSVASQTRYWLGHRVRRASCSQAGTAREANDKATREGPDDAIAFHSFFFFLLLLVFFLCLMCRVQVVFRPLSEINFVWACWMVWTSREGRRIGCVCVCVWRGDLFWRACQSLLWRPLRQLYSSTVVIWLLFEVLNTCNCYSFSLPFLMAPFVYTSFPLRHPQTKSPTAGWFTKIGGLRR